MSPLTLRFLIRSGCRLCDEARPLVARAARRAGAKLEEIDIERDDDLLQRFHLRIPVLLGPGGEVVAEGVIDDLRTLSRTLRRLKKGRG